VRAPRAAGGRERLWAAAAAAVVLLTFGGQLALAAWNRGGETARLVLDEGGVELPWTGSHEEGEALFLHLGAEAPELTLDELAPLGFAVEAMARDSGEEARLDVLPRSLWMVVDTTPEAWRRHLDRRQAEIERLERSDEVGEESVEAHRAALETLRKGPPQAVISAVGTDPAALRREHPDRARQAVVPGWVHPLRHWHGASWRGTPRPAVTSIVVPPALHRTVRRLVAAAEARREAPDEEAVAAPRFRAVVAWGRRHEPWLVAVEPLPESAPATRDEPGAGATPAAGSAPPAGAR
jgi:hypothetical protein